MKKRIGILGSTGSIGQSSLKVARHLKETIQVSALAVHSNIDLLDAQIREFQPDLVAVYQEDKARELQKRFPNVNIEAGMEGLKSVASYSGVDFVISALSGAAGLVPTMAAIEAGKGLGLANKEALVSGGALVTSLAKKMKVQIIPIDSEHSAIFQCLQGQPNKGEVNASVRRLILTASGGPFSSFTSEQLKSITPEAALCHPTWAMGPKVTIDCSTLMNKGLEVIEAYWLFNIALEKISVVIHPQSIIHSMVEFVDSSLLAQMGESSMIVPIQYALTYPDRLPGLLKPFDFTKSPTLQFLTPDKEKFRCLDLAYQAIRIGESLPCYMNAANEVLVSLFLQKKIEWNEIAEKLDTLMQRHSVSKMDSIEEVLAIDAEARREAISNNY